MTAARTARERARQELTDRLLEAAGRQLAEVGAAGLSVRAVARELGLASSAVYRYVPSRDALLTALLVAAYDEIGEAAERAAAGPGTPEERWLAVCRAVRAWARAHPHRWGLCYGTPVPGYAAPRDTVDPATRLSRAMAGLVTEAALEGRLAPPARPLPAPRLHTAAVEEVVGGAPPAPYEDLLERSLVLVVGLVGAVSYELWGHLVGTVTDLDAYFDRVVAVVAETVGLEVPLPA